MIRLTSWNRAAVRFLDPPRFAWEPVDGAASYLVRWAPGVEAARQATAREPSFDFAPHWPTLPVGGAVAWVVLALDDGGRPIDQTAIRTFRRAPDFDGELEPPADWRASALRNLDWLLGRPEVGGDPVYLRSSAEGRYDRAGEHQHPVAYPALHHPSYINLFLAAGEAAPDRRPHLHALARRVGDWLLDHQLPDAGACPRFPPSTWVSGSWPVGTPVVESSALTLFRAARVGESMLALHRALGEPAFLDYALHLARTFVRLQRPDGSWPYRLNPTSGEVVEEYTAAALCVGSFLAAAADWRPDSGFREAAGRALGWTLENPARTNRWQGMYEDVPATAPFENLENWSAIEAIVYLCRHADGHPGHLEVAGAINRYVEDQFVVFGPQESHLAVQTVYPAVLEQYVCYWPMEAHTGNWLRALTALHRATGDEQYRRKGLRAANAIVRMQAPDGRYATWGIDWRLGAHANPAMADWYGCNAVAATELLRWDRYAREAALV